MLAWSQTRAKAYLIEAQRLQRRLAHHAEACRGDRDCPLNALEVVMARHIVTKLRDGFTIVRWPAPRL